MNYNLIRFTQAIKSRLATSANIGFGLRLAWQSGPRLTLVNILLLTLQSVPPLLALYLMKLVLDSVTAGLSDGGSVEFADVLPLILMAGAVGLIEIILRAISSLVSEYQAEVVTDHLQSIIHAKAIAVDLEYYENHEYYNTLHMAQQQALSRPTSILSRMLQLGRAAVSLVLMAGLLLSLYWWVTLVLVLAVIPGVVVKLHYAQRIYQWQRERAATERLTYYLNYLITGVDFAKEIRLFQTGGIFRGRFAELRQQLRGEKLRISRRRSFAEVVAQGSGVIASFALYAFVVASALRGTITIGDLVMYYQAFRMAQGHLQTIFSSMAALYEDALFLSQVQTVLTLEPKVAEPTQPVKVPEPMQTGIAFENVSFRYPRREHDVLSSVNLTLRPGEIIALVGENGAGKTSLIKLLCRLYDPTAGKITLDGVDLREFDTTALRDQFSVIFQDYARYDMSARDNIWFGNSKLSPADEGIIAAAKESGAHEPISRLKDGYDNLLGTLFEGGAQLSMGEWQKVALARAFLSDAQIVVLDEPTSWMDAKAEYEVFEKFHEVMKNKTAILISHRLSTVRMADRIYVLDGGKIVESGTHDDLMRQNGAYAHLYEIQAQNYR